MSISELHDGEWRPAVPLPFYGFLHVTCRCGIRFWGRRIRIACPARDRYEDHYRREHMPAAVTP
jgi:hypothetical protein